MRKSYFYFSIVLFLLIFSRLLAASDASVNSDTTICLDPGHPSYEDDKLYEAIINRKVAFFLRECLENQGFSVLITVKDISRKDITNPYFDNDGEEEQSMLEIRTPEDRARLCNDWNGDYFISIHHNYAFDQTTNNALVLYHSDENEEPYSENARILAEMISTELEQTMKVDEAIEAGDNALLGDSLIVLKHTAMMAILTEASYFSNPEERERLNNNHYLKNEALAICRAFTEFIETGKQ